MKKILIYAFVGLLVTLIACEPIEIRDELGAIVPASDFDYEITQDPNNDYLVTLKNNTPGVMFSWNYAWGVTTKQETTVRMLVPGTYTIKITGTTAGGLVYDEYEVTVTDTDPDAFQEPEWEMLTNMASGKTWTWDTSLPGAYGNGGYKGCFSPCWWVLDGPAIDEQGYLNDKMILDLNGGRNMTLVSSEGTTKGSFNIDLTDGVDGWSVGKFITDNVHVPAGWDPNSGNAPFYRYDILEISAEELHLAASQPGTGDWGEAWFYMFSPEE